MKQNRMTELQQKFQVFFRKLLPKTDVCNLKIWKRKRSKKKKNNKQVCIFFVWLRKICN